MNKLTMLLGIILGTAAIPTRAADLGEPVTLENQVLRLEIQQAPAPFRPARPQGQRPGPGRPAGSQEPVFRSPSPNRTAARRRSTAPGRASRVSAWRKPTAEQAGSKLVIKYGKFPALDLTVEVTVSCDAPETPGRCGRCGSENNTGRRIKTVRFPQLLAVPAIGDGKDDCLVLPALGRHADREPGGKLAQRPERDAELPGKPVGSVPRLPGPFGGRVPGRDGSGRLSDVAWPCSSRPTDSGCWHEFTPVADAAKPRRTALPMRETTGKARIRSLWA